MLLTASIDVEYVDHTPQSAAQAIVEWVRSGAPVTVSVVDEENNVTFVEVSAIEHEKEGVLD